MATLAEQLAEAQDAYHSLVIGQAARVVIDQNGERVEFTPANRQQLYLYIQSLQRKVDEANGLTVPSRAPAGFFF